MADLIAEPQRATGGARAAEQSGIARKVHNAISQRRYSFRTTNDKRDDETWVAYWDRKRHEARGASRSCVVCRIEELKAHARRWPEYLATEQEQADPGDGALPTRPAA
jgi:hypothetical protein